MALWAAGNHLPSWLFMRLCFDCGSPFPASTDECPRCGALLKEPADPLVGAVFIDKYEIEEKLGTGGMCDVYRARHIGIGKAVAIKVLHAELAANPKVVERFEQEARAASLVRHPNAINIMDYGIAAGNTPFLVMELVEGATVRELLKRYGAMTVERVSGILNQACAALEAAHSVGVIHRDIKPENIIISEYDGKDWVEVVDFGIAKIQEDVNRRAALTGANLIIGTPRYMSPEQAEEQPADGRSDIYSLGIVVYEMLAGAPPFAGGSVTRLLIAHAVEPPPPLASQRPDIPPEVAAVVMRALDKNPARRQQSALEFASEFERAASAAPSPVSQITQSGLPGYSNMQRSEASLADQAGRMATPFTDEDEETLVRRAPRRAGHAATIEKTPPRAASDPAAETTKRRRTDQASDSGPVAAREHRKRLPALVVGLLALVLAGVGVAYIINHKRPLSNEPAIQQANDRAATTNANASSASSAENHPVDVRSNTPNPPSANRSENPTPAAAVDTNKAVNEVRDTVSRWNGALKSRNLDAHMAYFAPHLHTYFLKENVDRNAARAEAANALSLYSKLDIHTSPLAVSVDPSGNHAVVTYEKSWNFEGKQPWSGAAVERLWLERLNGRWRITGVRDLKQIR
jgi:serine/threonine protein kinase/ketosteroid isomerase-like protein